MPKDEWKSYDRPKAKWKVHYDRVSNPRDVFRMPFGKYKGKKLIKVPVTYMQWLLQQSFLDDRTRSSITSHLSTRGKPPTA